MTIKHPGEILACCSFNLTKSIPRSPSGALLPTFFFGEGSPTKLDYRKNGALVPTSLPEDLGAPNLCSSKQHLCSSEATSL